MEEEKSYRVPKMLSLSDVARLDVCEGGKCQNLPFTQLKDIAYQHGLDVDSGYEIRKGLHRNLYKEAIDGEYLIANERLDKEWISSGYATIEAIIESHPDATMRDEMRQKYGVGVSLHTDLENKIKSGVL